MGYVEDAEKEAVAAIQKLVDESGGCLEDALGYVAHLMGADGHEVAAYVKHYDGEKGVDA